MAAQHPVEQPPIDRWLHLALTERYGSALREPVPEALLDLLDPRRHP